MQKLILGMLALVVLLAPSVHAAPQPLTDDQVEQIRRNCQTSQGVLQQIHRSDAVARINRGQEYESMMKLLANFNSRVALNKLDAGSLVSTTSNLGQKISAFQADYLDYEDALNATLNVKCREQPVTFYDSLTNVRDLRAKVRKDIQEINALFDTYQTSLTVLRASISTPKDGVAQ